MAKKRRRHAARSRQTKRSRKATTAADAATAAVTMAAEQNEDDEEVEEDIDDHVDDKVYEVEAVRGRSGSKYLIKWKGYQEETWEDEGNLNCDDLIREFEDKENKKKRARRSTDSRRGGATTTPRTQSADDHAPSDQLDNLCDRVDGAPREDIASRVLLDDDDAHPVRNASPTGSHGHPSANRIASETHDGNFDESDDESKTDDDERARHDSEVTRPSTAKKKRQSKPVQQTSPKGAVGGIERALIGKLVAYSPKSDRWLSHKTYAVVGSTFIVGRICLYHFAKKQGLYEIRWLDSMFQNRVEKVDLSIVKQGRQNYDQLQEQLAGRRDNPRWRRLVQPDPGCEVLVDDDDDLVEYRPFEALEQVPVSVAEVEHIKNMTFEPDARLREPSNLFTNDNGSTITHVKPEFEHLFQHSASASFFAYLPLNFWKQVLQHTNEQAKALKLSLGGEPFTMHELMAFLGILWFMAVVDKGEYANYWGEQMESAIFATASNSLDNVMPLRRFKVLRAAFCFRQSTDVSIDDLKRDAAARVRPLLNMLKLTSSRYVNVGRNLAVDEASVAARSKYARHIIVYNPRKPTGKYHFKLYMCCCATSWIALNFRLHCDSTLTDRLDSVVDESDVAMLENEIQASAKTRQVVLEVVRPYFGTHRIVNCDNYYTSVQLLEALRLKGLYCRGTVKRLSKHFPRHVVLGEPNKADKNSNKSKSKRTNTTDDVDSDDNNDNDLQLDGARVDGEVRRGDYLQAVAKTHRIVAASWCDGNIVTIISNADASAVSSVTRLVKGKHIGVPAPTCIKQYNQHMQGVDRNDQVRARFSIADGHSFKKWYKKLGLAIIDIARVNAFLTRRLQRGEENDERDSHRQFMIELIQEMISGRWQSAPSDSVMLFGDDDEAEEAPSPRVASGAQSPAVPRASPYQVFSPSSAQITCSGVESSQMFEKTRRKRMCIVCRLEGRKDTIITEYCVDHKVCLCKRVYPDSTNPFGCQRVEWTCWEKFHQFYLSRNTFTKTGCVRRHSAIYMDKKKWEADQGQAADQAQQVATVELNSTTASRSLSFAESESSDWRGVSPSPLMSVNTPTPSFTSLTGTVTPTPSHDYY